MGQIETLKLSKKWNDRRKISGSYQRTCRYMYYILLDFRPTYVHVIFFVPVLNTEIQNWVVEIHVYT